jgi:hypothetical protein
MFSPKLVICIVMLRLYTFFALCVFGIAIILTNNHYNTNYSYNDEFGFINPTTNNIFFGYKNDMSRKTNGTNAAVISVVALLMLQWILCTINDIVNYCIDNGNEVGDTRSFRRVMFLQIKYDNLWHKCFMYCNSFLTMCLMGYMAYVCLFERYRVNYASDLWIVDCNYGYDYTLIPHSVNNKTIFRDDFCTTINDIYYCCVNANEIMPGSYDAYRNVVLKQNMLGTISRIVWCIFAIAIYNANVHCTCNIY